MKLIDVDNFLKQYSDQVHSYAIDTIDSRLALLKEWVLVELLANTPTVEAIPVEWLKNELIPKAEKLGATEYANNIKFVLEDWEAWKRYRGLMERDDKSELFNPETTFDDIIKMVAGEENES